MSSSRVGGPSGSNWKYTVSSPLVDAPPVPVLLAHRDAPGHPALPALSALAHEIVRRSTTDG
ncbi:hypothetical protein ACIO87_24280 [Streptomyces sp. NPDC087218]|uniref:hypothetical protein n=1 Tax=Streptomyces sp. NPDC087218 TaxID=3365769 RepID=UPI003811FFAC